MNNNQDLKVLRERNIELTNKLKDEFKHRDEAVQRLIKAEQNGLKYFNQIQTYEDDLKNLDALKSQNEKLKGQLKQYNVDYRKLIKEKEELNKYNLLFKDNLPDLEKSKLNPSCCCFFESLFEIIISFITYQCFPLLSFKSLSICFFSSTLLFRTASHCSTSLLSKNLTYNNLLSEGLFILVCA